MGLRVSGGTWITIVAVVFLAVLAMWAYSTTQG